MEQAHEFARVHTDSKMRRHKRYHDNKLSWEKFEVGDELFVLLLRWYPGISPKFIANWYGPYEVIVKYSDVAYGLKNKRTGSEKPVHIDRMKK